MVVLMGAVWRSCVEDYSTDAFVNRLTLSFLISTVPPNILASTSF